MQCKSLLCIDCILNDGHKNHEISAIEKASEVEKSIFFDYFKRAQELEEKLKSQIMDMTKHIDSVRGQANKNRNQLSKIFNNVRNQLATRENELKQKIAEVMMNQEEQIETKKQILEEQVDQIGDFKRRVRQIQDDTNISVLTKTPVLYEESEDALQSVGGINLKEPLTNIREDLELTDLCLLIYPQIFHSGKKNTAKYPLGGVKPEAQLEAKRAKPQNQMKKGQAGISPPVKKVAKTGPKSMIGKVTGPGGKKFVKQASQPMPGTRKIQKKEPDVLEMINQAKDSVERNFRPTMTANKLSKKTPSTSSGSSTKGNEAKAKNFYE